MKKQLALLGSVTLALSSFGAWAQQTGAPEIPPVPGTDGTITSPNAAAADQVFGTTLTGAEEVPPQQTAASGAVVVALNEQGTGLTYRLAVSGLENVVGAHLHLGLPNENGPIVVALLGAGASEGNLTPPQGAANGVIAEGEITGSSLVGPLANTPLSVVLELMRSGAIYANVHTSQLPAGELRGQVQGLAPSTEGAAALAQLLQEDDAPPPGDGDESPDQGGGTADGTGEDTGQGTADDAGETAEEAPQAPYGQ